jgi:ATP-dependent Lon protease
VLDPEQNNSFSDHYIEAPFDLSRVLFIATANTLSTIPPALLDRMEVIELSGYTEQEKLAIAEQYLVPRQIEAHGLTTGQVTVERAALEKVIGEYTREAGVRNLERHVATLMRKSARRIAAKRDERITIGPDDIAEALGAPPHLPETAEASSIPGVAVGLAVTAHGGDILFIEAADNPGGQGIRLRLTGQLGDVMRESARIALSWTRAHGSEVGIHPADLAGREIHVHVPAGAIPKDGPSAGVTMITAIASLASGRPVKPTVGMTGEVTLQGRVLPIGGLKQKVLAAHRAGLTDVIIPERNRRDLDDVPAQILEKVRVHPVLTVREVLDIALEPARDRHEALAA